jgi:outer membrane protein X
MKKFLKIAVVTLFMVIAYANTTKAQDFKLGAGLAFGSEVENVGLHVRGDIPLSDSWRAAPAINIFFPGNDLNWFEINLDANYIIPIQSDVVGLYGLAGLNLAFIGVDDRTIIVGGTPVEVDGETNSELGINLGLGAEFNIESSVTPFAEIKYVFGDWDQAVLAAGVKFSFN